MDMSALLGSAVVALLGAAYIATAILALVSILRSGQDVVLTVVWCGVVLVAPLLGSLAWFAVGRRRARVLPGDRLR
jgi:Phospholipase_D-nuclease N-terminal